MNSALNDDECLLGIDLGTTNSCAFYITKSKPSPQKVIFEDGSYLLPSCVWYRADGTVVVGSNAKRQVGKKNRFAVVNSKRLIGKRVPKSSEEELSYNFGCSVETIHEKPVFIVSSKSQTRAPSDIAAEIIRTIKKRAETITEKKIKKVMVTFPAHFDNNQRTATLLALKKAGFEHQQIRMMNEPTAASFSYPSNSKKRIQNILVYDLGGGTFDVSVLQIEEGRYRVLSYAGDNNLGGADFDLKISEDFEKLFLEKNHASLYAEVEDDESVDLLRRRCTQEAENAKKDLSTSLSVEVDLNFINVNGGDDDDDDDDEDKYTISYTRERMNSILSDSISRTMITVDEALRKAGLQSHQIDRVLLVGGSSRLRLVREKIINKFGQDLISEEVNCDESVAEGACRALFNNTQSFERIAYSLGQHVFYREEMVECIIPKGTPIPVRCSLQSQTSDPYTTILYSGISQGNAEKQGEFEPILKSIVLDRYTLEGLTPLPVLTIITTFYIDEAGLVHITEREKETNKVIVNDRVILWEEPAIVM